MKATPELEKQLEELKQCLRTIGHMSRAAVDDPLHTFSSLGATNEAAKGLLVLARLRKTLETTS